MNKFFSVVLLLITLYGNAQNRSLVDSLLRETDISKPDTTRMQAFYRLGKSYMDNNATKSIEYLEKAKTIALQTGKINIIAGSYYTIGHCYKTKLEFEKALYNYQQSEKYYIQLKDTFRLSNALMAIGNVYGDFKKPEKTTEYYKRAQQLVEQTNDTLQLSNIYGQRGVMLDQAGQFEAALKYLQKSYELQLLIADSNYAYSSLSNLGLTYKHMHRHEEAIRCFDTVLAYYERVNFAAFNKGIVYNNVGATYAQWGKYDKALEAFNKSLAFAKEAEVTNITMENYRNMADMFGDMNDYRQQAAYLTKYYHLKDSLFNLESQNRVTQLEADYQIERKNAELVTQGAEVEKQKNQRNIFIILAATAAVILLLLSVFYNRIRKTNRELKEKNIQISEQKEQLQKLNHVKDRLFGIISHDLRNPLATLRSYLSLTADETLPAEKKELFRQQTINMVSSTSDMLNNLLAWANVQMKNVHASITPISIGDCIQDIVYSVEPQAQQKGITLRQNITAETALGDYDIVSIALRNLVTNAVKFSERGDGIDISSVSKNGHILLSVADTGKGMSDVQIEKILKGTNTSSEGTAGEKGSGLGLFLTTELLQKINAELLIESKEGEGSRFTIVMARA